MHVVSISVWTQIQLGLWQSLFMLYLCIKMFFRFCPMSLLARFIYLAQIQQKEGKKHCKYKGFTPPHSSQLHTPRRLISFLSKGIRPLWCSISKTRMFSHKTFTSALGKMWQTFLLHTEGETAQELPHKAHGLALEVQHMPEHLMQHMPDCFTQCIQYEPVLLSHKAAGEPQLSKCRCCGQIGV